MMGHYAYFKILSYFLMSISVLIYLSVYEIQTY